MGNCGATPPGGGKGAAVDAPGPNGKPVLGCVANMEKKAR